MADRKPATIPPHVEMGAHRYEVRCDADTAKLLRDEQSSGDTRADQLIIRLDPDRPHTALAEVLVHELLHCAWHQSGIRQDDKPDEESIVTGLAPRIIELLRRNPELVKFLTGDSP